MNNLWMLASLGGGAALALWAVRTLVREHRRRQAPTAGHGGAAPFAATPAAHAAAARRDGPPAEATGEQKTHSVPNGYEIESEFEGVPLQVNGWPVRCGTRRYVRRQRDPLGSALPRAPLIRGFVALCAADVPEALRVPWRLPASNDARPAACMVRSLWADLSLHRDDRVELELPDVPEVRPEYTLAAARRLVAGVHALAQSEADLLFWLVTPLGDEAPGVNATAAHVWRVDLLFTWFADNAHAKSVARRERISGDPSTRMRAGILLDDRSLLLETASQPVLSAELVTQGVLHGAALAFAVSDFAWLAQALAVSRRNPQLTAALGRIVVKADEPQAVPCLVAALTALAHDEDLAVALFKRIEGLGGAALALEVALVSPVDALRRRADIAALRTLGSAGHGALCMTLLQRQTEMMRGATDTFGNARVALSLLQVVAQGGTAEHLPALRRWINARDWNLRPLEDVRDAVAAAIDAIRARQPAELAGALSMVDGEAGALSVARPSGADIGPPDDDT